MLTALVCIVLLALVFDFINGFHDASAVFQRLLGRSAGLFLGARTGR